MDNISSTNKANISSGKIKKKGVLLQMPGDLTFRNQNFELTY